MFIWMFWTGRESDGAEEAKKIELVIAKICSYWTKSFGDLEGTVSEDKKVLKINTDFNTHELQTPN